MVQFFTGRSGINCNPSLSTHNFQEKAMKVHCGLLEDTLVTEQRGLDAYLKLMLNHNLLQPYREINCNSASLASLEPSQAYIFVGGKESLREVLNTRRVQYHDITTSGGFGMGLTFGTQIKLLGKVKVTSPLYSLSTKSLTAIMVFNPSLDQNFMGGQPGWYRQGQIYINQDKIMLPELWSRFNDWHVNRILQKRSIATQNTDNVVKQLLI
jgi:hypothetical protein